jgi:carbon storage regulator CsrA
MMQIISRQENEGLVIGDDIHVTVLKIQETEVRLAISSPNDSPSYWEETLYWEPAESTQQLQLN